VTPPATLAPWTFDQALDMTWRVVTGNFAAFFIAGLALNAPQLAIALADGDDRLATMVAFVFSLVVAVAITVGTLQALAGKRRPDAMSLLGWLVQPLAGRAVLLGILQWLAIPFGLLLVVPGLWVLALWMVALPALVVERCGIGQALNRSTELTRGRRWRVLAVFGVTALLMATVMSTINFGIGALVGPVAGLPDNAAGDLVLFWLTGTVVDIVLASVAAVLYVLLRAEKEGVSLEAIATALE
jgi:hypothetical protein